MAGDWIKMRTDLQTHPKVVRIVSALNADKCPQSVQILSDKFRVIGALHAVWSLFDAHSTDGVLEGYTPEVLDSAIGLPGFTLALASVGWVSVDAQALVLPRFEDHNGQSAKRRAQDADRKQAVRKMSAPEADKKRTREEKRREEEKKEKPRAGARPLSAYIEECKAKGEKPIPDDDPIFDYAEKVGLPFEYLSLAWGWFKDQMAGKRKTDWRAHFRNAVKGNWPKYWYPTDDGGWRLSPAGEQARRASA